MTAEADDMFVDHEKGALVWDDGLEVEFSEIFGGAGPARNQEVNYTFTYDFTVKQTFEESLGKYS